MLLFPHFVLVVVQLLLAYLLRVIVCVAPFPVNTSSKSRGNVNERELDRKRQGIGREKERKVGLNLPQFFYFQLSEKLMLLSSQLGKNQQPFQPVLRYTKMIFSHLNSDPSLIPIGKVITYSLNEARQWVLKRGFSGH